MNIFKKGFALLLCGASVLLSSCSSKYENSSVTFNVKEEGFVLAEFDLEQTKDVDFNISFGIAIGDSKSSWEQIRDKYGISYFVLHVYSRAIFRGVDNIAEHPEIFNSYAYISEEYVVYVGKDTDLKIEEKIYKEDFNKAKEYKTFYCNKSISLDAHKFEMKGDITSLEFCSIVLDSEYNEIETFGSYSKRKYKALKCEFTYSDMKVSFIKEKCIPCIYN